MTTLQQLKAVYERQDFLVLDTETTGLHRGEICQIALIDHKGVVLLDSLVNPVNPIPMDAQRIHGITDDMVKDAPNWREIESLLYQMLAGRELVVYNATYDRKMMHQSREAWGLPKIEWTEVATWYCAMLAYAEFRGDWNDYHGNYRWQKLTIAASQMGVDIVDAHAALGDCRLTLAVLNKMFGG